LPPEEKSGFSQESDFWRTCVTVFANQKYGGQSSEKTTARRVDRLTVQNSEVTIQPPI
jgi:hypothetical protein